MSGARSAQAPGGSATARATSPARSDQRYFQAASVGIAAVVFAGFAHTYYLRSFTGLPPLPLRLHVHGAVMTGWVLILVVQVCLVRFRRIAWHRLLGWVGASIASLVVALGCTTTLHAAAREVRGHTSEAAAQLTILGLELTQMALFAILVTAAMVRRHEPGDHKRLMLLATLCLLPSPIGRLPVSLGQNAMILFWFDLVVLGLVAIDRWRLRRLHPACGWGAAVLLGGLNAAYVGAYTDAWRQFAGWFIS